MPGTNASTPGTTGAEVTGPHRAAARRLLAGRNEARVLAAMWPQQPDALLAALIITARERGVRLTVLLADIPGRFAFLDDACGDDLDAGRLELVTVAGAVPRAWSSRTGHVPRSLWDVDRLIARGGLGVDIFVARVTRAGPGGQVGLGEMVGYTPAALGTDAVVAFEVSPGPSRPGTEPTSLDRAAVVVPVPDPAIGAGTPLPRPPDVRPGTAADTIGRLAAALVPDGATLQLGLGSLPEALVGHLAGRRDLGIHSGILSPALLPLIRAGVVTGRLKQHGRGHHVATGLFDLDPASAQRDWGPDIRLEPVSRTHAPDRLLALEQLWAVNSALEIDLAGQPNAEYAAGVRIASGGGQADFVRAAHASAGGAAVLVLPSRTKDGRSRIVTRLGDPAVPTSPGADVDLVVTEHGVADLRGRTAAEVATELISVAHPGDRDRLRAGTDRALG